MMTDPLKDALRAICADARATYDHIANNNSAPVISIGQFGRLEHAEAMLAAPAPKTLAVELACLALAIANCSGGKNDEWAAKHRDRLDTLCKDMLPSGGGINAGVKFDLVRSTPDKLVFDTAYHHMNDGGYYDGWTDHTITVRASLAHGLTIAISGRDRNGIKDHLHEVFSQALQQVVPPAA